MRRDLWYSSLTISPITNPSLLPVTGEPPHNYLHTHIHCASNHQSLLPVFRSWSDTENFYTSDRSILTLSPIEVTHCWLPGPLTVKHRRATMNCNHPPRPPPPQPFYKPEFILSWRQMELPRRVKPKDFAKCNRPLYPEDLILSESVLNGWKGRVIGEKSNKLFIQSACHEADTWSCSWNWNRFLQMYHQG